MHWLTALAVVAAFILGPEHFGRQMHNSLDPATRWDIVWHETLGLAVAALTLLRLLWSAVHPLTLLGGIRVTEMPVMAQFPLASLADWGDVHGLLGDLIVWLAGLHPVAAIWHHRVLQDGVLRAMPPPRD